MIWEVEPTLENANLEPQETLTDIAGTWEIHKLVDWNERLQYLESLTNYLAYLWVKIVTIPHLQSGGYHISSKPPESAHHKKRIIKLTKFRCRDRKHNLTN